MHLAFYRLRPDVRAVCHAHPPTTTAFAIASLGLNAPVLPEVLSDIGEIPLARYATPGTNEMCLALRWLIPSHDAILLQNHGIVTCGEDLQAAYFRVETVEHLAITTLLARTLGEAHLLSERDMRKLIAHRSTANQLRIDATTACFETRRP